MSCINSLGTGHKFRCWYSADSDVSTAAMSEKRTSGGSLISVDNYSQHVSLRLMWLSHPFILLPITVGPEYHYATRNSTKGSMLSCDADGTTPHLTAVSGTIKFSLQNMRCLSIALILMLRVLTIGRVQVLGDWA